MEGKQFIKFRLEPNIVVGTIYWSKLMRLCILLALFCHFRAQRFHTLKIESDFFSRQGHWTLYGTGVYQSPLLKKNQRRSWFLFFYNNGKITGNSINVFYFINWTFVCDRPLFVVLAAGQSFIAPAILHPKNFPYSFPEAGGFRRPARCPLPPATSERERGGLRTRRQCRSSSRSEAAVLTESRKLRRCCI